MVRAIGRVAAMLAASVVLTACTQPELTDQPKYEPYSEAPGWPNDQAARVPATGTVPMNADLSETPQKLPYPLTRQFLERGRERFDIYCSPCHDRLGTGQGMIVRHGFPAPPSFQSAALRAMPLRHFYDVITDGFGRMYSYADRVPPRDRWRIAAYIRALQNSQHMRVDDLTSQERAQLASESSR